MPGGAVSGFILLTLIVAIFTGTVSINVCVWMARPITPHTTLAGAAAAALIGFIAVVTAGGAIVGTRALAL